MKLASIPFIPYTYIIEDIENPKTKPLMYTKNMLNIIPMIDIPNIHIKNTYVKLIDRLFFNACTILILSLLIFDMKLVICSVTLILSF